MAIAEEPFVLSGWIRSHRAMMSRALRKPKAIAEYDAEVRRIVNECPPVVAFSPESPATLLGFACGTPEVLHFVYVPSDLRCMGMARLLIQRVMAGYPERISCGHPWPWKSSRFVYEPRQKAA